MTLPPTLSQYLIRELINHPEREGLVSVMSDLATIGKIISNDTNRAGLVQILGCAGKINVQEEEVQKLDEFCNEICKNYLRQTGHFAAMASEEEAGVVDMGDFGEGAKYVISFDPLDGSSNIDVNVSVGTIFSVHRRLPQYERADERQFLQSGRGQVLAGYILYGSSTVLVFSWGNNVHEFTLDQGLGEFLLSREKMTMPKTCKIYSVNEGNFNKFQPQDRQFIVHLKDDKKCTSRYIGSLVADFHRNLIKGGIFLYPATKKENAEDFEGKLRLNFEAKPMAYLIEHAGGLAIDGQENILDIIPTALHQRVPLFIGNKEIVEEYLKSQIVTLNV